MELNKIGIIIQARYNSERLKGKVLKKITNISILELIILRLRKSKKVDTIIVACSKNEDDKKIIELCRKLKVHFFLGSEKNVLKRYFDAAKYFKLSHIVRITADCPLICPKLIDEMVINYSQKKTDYLSNVNPPTYPDGMDIEIFNYKVLQKAFLNSKFDYQKEHVTKYIINSNEFKKNNYFNKIDCSELRITVDYEEDIKIIKNIIKFYKNDYYVNYKQIQKLLMKKDFSSKNNIPRNFGEVTSTGQRNWIKAKKIIPGGTMLFSKNPDLYLPKKWPAYFSKTKGCTIWDLDNKRYEDMSVMGLGTNILGYSNSLIDNEVKKIIDKGNLSTLNNHEEVILAEKLIEMHSWSKMVRHVRTGAEANSLAIRLARSATGKNKVGICGYHGWNDWYLSSNLKDKKNLNTHLLNNLRVDGVDKSLKNSTFVFNFNDYKRLKKIEASNDYAAIIMELARKDYQNITFLKKIRKICDKKNIVLIFDECTSGFRASYGGLHLKLGINPDIATFGKALGNGYSICSVVGKEEVMKEVKNTFVSSTFWTDRIGPVAAIKTLDQMKKIKSWEIITKQGKIYKKLLKKIAKKNNINIEINGLDALPKFNFKKFNNYFKTFIAQEFLKKNILATNGIYICINHTDIKFKKYFEILDEVFYKIALNNKQGNDPAVLIENEVCIENIREINK
jgi:glutamate-1-semialdehyde 2,1-aminomutase